MYVRYRGRVTGPYSPDELATMVRRRTLSRAHEVSNDGSNWVAAASVPGLFQGSLSQPAQASVRASVPQQSQAVEPAMQGPGVCYQQDGSNFGPVPLVIVESLAINGALAPDSLVWIEGEPALPAVDHPLMMNVQWPEAAGIDPGQSTRPNSRAGMSGCATALVAGVLLLVAAGIFLAIKLTPGSGDSSPKPAVNQPVMPRP